MSYDWILRVCFIFLLEAFYQVYDLEVGREDPWRRQWEPTPVLLPGKSHGQRSLVGYSPWGRKESDTTEWLHFHFSPAVWLISFKKFLIYLFSIWLQSDFVILCLLLCMDFLSCNEWGPPFVAVLGPLIAVASLMQSIGSRHTGSEVGARGLQSTGSATVVHGLSCSLPCGTFLIRDWACVLWVILKWIHIQCATREVFFSFLKWYVLKNANF